MFIRRSSAPKVPIAIVYTLGNPPVCVVRYNVSLAMANFSPPGQSPNAILYSYCVGQSFMQKLNEWFLEQQMII